MITISVTQEDITKGKPRNCEGCPLALACTRAFGKPISVGAYMIHLATYGQDSVELPTDALAFRKAFDAGRTVKPFTFEVSAS